MKWWFSRKEKGPKPIKPMDYYETLVTIVNCDIDACMLPIDKWPHISKAIDQLSDREFHHVCDLHMDLMKKSIREYKGLIDEYGDLVRREREEIERSKPITGVQ